MFSQTIKRLLAAGLTAEQMSVVVEEIERACNETQRNNVASSGGPIERRAMTNTERSRVFRERKKAEAATEVQRNETKPVASLLPVSPGPPSLSNNLSSKEVMKKEKNENAREGGIDVDGVVALWNRFADYANTNNLCAKECKISKIVKLTKSRRASATQRLTTYTPEQLKKALNITRQTPGLLGHNDRKWRANIDWFLRPNTIASILEGKYDNWKPNTNGFNNAFASLERRFAEDGRADDGAGRVDPTDETDFPL